MINIWRFLGLQQVVNRIRDSLEDFLYNFSPARIDFIKLGEKMIWKM